MSRPVIDREAERVHAEWMHATLNSVFKYQWKALAFGGNSVQRSVRFQPKPPAALPFGRRTAKKYLRFWLSRSRWGVDASQRKRASIHRRYGPIVVTEKPMYWSDCHGCEPTLFRHDPEWSIESWFEHRRKTMSNWTGEDEAKERAWFEQRHTSQ